jgi:hypothetical protein
MPIQAGSPNSDNRYDQIAVLCFRKAIHHSIDAAVVKHEGIADQKNILQAVGFVGNDWFYGHKENESIMGNTFETLYFLTAVLQRLAGRFFMNLK